MWLSHISSTPRLSVGLKAFSNYLYRQTKIYPTDLRSTQRLTPSNLIYIINYANYEIRFLSFVRSFFSAKVIMLNKVLKKIFIYK